MSTVLVTGGAGFIGSHTCVELIAEGYRPLIVDDFRNSRASVIDGIESITGKRPEVLQLDCNDKDAMAFVMKQKDVKSVIHFAAYKSVGESVQEPLKYYMNNIGSLSSVIFAMKRANVRKLIFSSSCTVYGNVESCPVVEDTTPGKITSPYGYTKAVCEKMIKDEMKAGNIDGTSLRYFNPIGAHESSMIGELPLGFPTNLVPVMAMAASGVGGPLKIFGQTHDTEDGTCVRDYIHVSDVAKAHVLALRSKPITANLGLGLGTSVKQLIEIFEEVNGVKVPTVTAPPRPGDVAKIWCLPDIAKIYLGWKPRKGIDEALCDAWNWQKKIM